MECGISMIRRPEFLLLVLLTCVLTSSAQAERSVVLVTGENCAMKSISMLDVRKAYLGISVSYEGQHVRAFRLNNDEELNRVFFQTVVAMSERSYDRRLLSMLLKYGTPRPEEVQDLAALVVALSDSSCGIAYVWSDDIQPTNGLRNIRLLWQGD